MKNKKATISGNYMTAWEDAGKRPCLLEQLLSDPRKTKNLIEVLKALNLKVEPYTDNRWFDIVKH